MSGVFTRVAIRLIICGAVFVVAALGLWIRVRDSLQRFVKRCLASRVLRGCPGATRGDTMGASPPLVHSFTFEGWAFLAAARVWMEEWAGVQDRKISS